MSGRCVQLWAPIAETPNYHCMFQGVSFIAVYMGTVRGFGNYMTIKAGVKPIVKNDLAWGSKPDAYTLRALVG